MTGIQMGFGGDFPEGGDTWRKQEGQCWKDKNYQKTATCSNILQPSFPGTLQLFNILNHIMVAAFKSFKEEL